tara:strand:- start:282 stop:569 length:288 start_codon:yes stop_codon:yes gene_type:complete
MVILMEATHTNLTKGNSMKTLTITNNSNEWEFQIHADGCRDLARTEANAPFGHTWKCEVRPNNVVEDAMADINEDFDDDDAWDEGHCKFNPCCFK